MKALELPTLQYLGECFQLSTESPSGLLWKARPREHFNTDRGWKQSNVHFAGKLVGTLHTNPKNPDRKYWIVGVAGVRYQIHRIVYALYHSVRLTPSVDIDHANMDSLDNCPSNLRIATRGENCNNKSRRPDNTSGFKGVHYDRSSKVWYGRVQKGDKRYNVGGCPTAEKAHELLCELRQSLHKEFTNHG